MVEKKKRRLRKRRYYTADLTAHIADGLDMENPMKVKACAVFQARAMNPKLLYKECAWKLIWYRGHQARIRYEWS